MSKVPGKVQRAVLRYALRRRRTIAATTEKKAQEFLAQQKERVVEKYLSQARGLVVRGYMDGEDEALKASFSPFYSEGMAEERASIMAYFGEDAKALESWEVQKARRLARLLPNLVRVNQTTSEEIARTIKEGLELGLSPGQIASGEPDLGFPGIEGTFENLTPWRAQLIGRTESMYLQEAGNSAGYEELGVKVLDVIGCEDNVILPGEEFGCNSKGIPVERASSIEYHPNHRGALVPSVF